MQAARRGGYPRGGGFEARGTGELDPVGRPINASFVVGLLPAVIVGQTFSSAVMIAGSACRCSARPGAVCGSVSKNSDTPYERGAGLAQYRAGAFAIVLHPAETGKKGRTIRIRPEFSVFREGGSDRRPAAAMG